MWWTASAIVAILAVVIGGVLVNGEFFSPGEPTHTVVAPQTVDGYTRSADLEKQLNIADQAQTAAKGDGGQATSVAYGVYQHSGGSTQIFTFVGGKPARSDPAASLAIFKQDYPGAATVSPGSLGGQEACAETTANRQSTSMCVWYDNDTFGSMTSPTMTTAELATTMNAVRPSLELYQK
jgi:hypothetical protein